MITPEEPPCTHTQDISSSPSCADTFIADIHETASVLSDSTSHQGNEQLPSPEGSRRSSTIVIDLTTAGCSSDGPAAPSLPASDRQHPRRTNSGEPPPTLARQVDRKTLFVNDLVDSATTMLEVIWPATSSSMHISASGLTMRRYVEETLRRSRTSYSTLQAALYYLVLVQSGLKRLATPREPLLRCGRRTFLAALILASKYLQDRNYSTKAWSKMSGLDAREINNNERVFLEVVGYRLHIPAHIFTRWTGIVLRFSNSSSLGRAPSVKSMWRHVIPLLEPELENATFISLARETISRLAPRSGLLSPQEEPEILLGDITPAAEGVGPCSEKRSRACLGVDTDALCNIAQRRKLNCAVNIARTSTAPISISD